LVDDEEAVRHCGPSLLQQTAERVVVETVGGHPFTPTAQVPLVIGVEAALGVPPWLGARWGFVTTVRERQQRQQLPDDPQLVVGVGPPSPLPLIHLERWFWKRSPLVP